MVKAAYYYPQEIRILITMLKHYGEKIKDFDIGPRKLTPFLEQKTFLPAYQSHLKKKKEYLRN